MKIIVFGANGLLGSHLCALHPSVIGLSHSDCDITNPTQLEKVFTYHEPNVVINCAGIVPKNEQDVLTTFRVNATGPKLLRDTCDLFDTRLIQVSTDCVYGHGIGYATENDIPEPNSVYGMSKYLGEPRSLPHITLRMSFVGYPSPNNRNLLAWAVQQGQLEGWTRSYWNGLTSIEAANQLMFAAHADIPSGLYHLHGLDTLSKYEVLQKCSDAFGWNLNITPVEKPEMNRTLATVKDVFNQRSFDDMLSEMVEKQVLLESCYR